MDALRSAIENVSLYDVKAAVRKAQNGESAVAVRWRTPEPYRGASLAELASAGGGNRFGNRQMLTAVTVVMNYTEMEAKVGLLRARWLKRGAAAYVPPPGPRGNE